MCIIGERCDLPMIGFTVSQKRAAALATLLGISKKSDAALAILHAEV